MIAELEKDDIKNSLEKSNTNLDDAEKTNRIAEIKDGKINMDLRR